MMAFFHIMNRKKTVLLLCLCIGCMVVMFSVSQTLGTRLKAKIMNQGAEGNIIIVDEGADTPMFSSLPPETYDFIKTVPHIKKESGEFMITRCLLLASLISGRFTMVRGVDPAYYRMYDQCKLTRGRLPGGKNEVIIGDLFSAKINKKIKTGDTINFEGSNWKIVGIFEDRLTVMGSGIIAGLKDLQNATNRRHISFVSLHVDAPENMKRVKEYIEKTYDALLIETPEVPGVIVEPEQEYYHNEAEAINPMVMFINMVNLLCLIVGTMIMYNIAHYIFLPFGKPVGDGYGRRSAAMIIMEVLSVAVVGGIAGAVVTYLIKNVSINFMFMTFFLESSPRTILAGILLATLLALLSASPIVRKVRVEENNTGLRRNDV